MEYLIQTEYRDDYGSNSYKLNRYALSRYLDEMSDLTKRIYGTVSSLIRHPYVPIVGGWRFFRRYRDQFVMVLDCDGTNEMIMATHTLAKDQVGYALIQSSPRRYWVVTDVVGHFRQLHRRASAIPGVDTKWLTHAWNIASFTLRGVSLPGRVPLFSEPTGLTNPHSVRFFTDLQSLHNHPVIKRRLENEVLLQAAKEDKIMDLASNPSFKI